MSNEKVEEQKEEKNIQSTNVSQNEKESSDKKETASIEGE